MRAGGRSPHGGGGTCRRARRRARERPRRGGPAPPIAARASASRPPPDSRWAGSRRQDVREVAQRFRCRQGPGPAGRRGGPRLTRPTSTRWHRARARGAPVARHVPEQRGAVAVPAQGERHGTPRNREPVDARGCDLATPAAAAGRGPRPEPSAPRAAGPTTPRTGAPSGGSSGGGSAGPRRATNAATSATARGSPAAWRISAAPSSAAASSHVGEPRRRAWRARPSAAPATSTTHGAAGSPSRTSSVRPRRNADRVVGRRRPLQQQRRPGRHEVVGQRRRSPRRARRPRSGRPSPAPPGRRPAAAGPGCRRRARRGRGRRARRCGDRPGSPPRPAAARCPRTATSVGGRAVSSAPWLKATANGSGEAFSISTTVRPPSSAVQ